MALTADEKRRASKLFVRISYKKLNITSAVDVPAIEAAAEATYDYLISGAVQTAINNEFPAIFKADASDAEKAIMVSVMALHIAGELPN